MPRFLTRVPGRKVVPRTRKSRLGGKKKVSSEVVWNMKCQRANIPGREEKRWEISVKEYQRVGSIRKQSAGRVDRMAELGSGV